MLFSVDTDRSASRKQGQDMDGALCAGGRGCGESRAVAFGFRSRQSRMKVARYERGRWSRIEVVPVSSLFGRISGLYIFRTYGESR